MNPMDLAEYTLFRSLVGGLRALPYDQARGLLVWLGRRLRTTALARGPVVRRQLARVYGSGDGIDLDSLQELIYTHLALTVAETFCGDLEQQLRDVQVNPGWEPLDRALAHGRGAILATGHLGNFELGGALLARRYSLLDVVKTQRNRLFDGYLDSMRRRRGIATVPMARSAGAVLRHLRQGQVVSLLLDQDAGARGLMIDFLGRPASTWPGAARISLRTGCPVVPVAMVRDPAGGHTFRIGTPLHPMRQADNPAGVAAYLQEISTAFEAFVREHPEQWFWVHRRWKSGKEVEAG